MYEWKPHVEILPKEGQWLELRYWGRPDDLSELVSKVEYVLT